MRKTKRIPLRGYIQSYRDIKPLLRSCDVKKINWGMYRAFILELISTVYSRRHSTKEMIIAKWVDNGLVEEVLTKIASFIHDNIERYRDPEEELSI